MSVDGTATSDRPIGRVLVTNDDGIDAEGIALLERVAAEIAQEVWTVAPATDQSGVSHSISIHHPLRLVERGPRRYAVTGTPSDCIIMALGQVMTDNPPELVLSGVNRGANLGDALNYSGTTSAAMTGMMLGVPGLALSQQFTPGEAIPWQTAERYAPGLIRAILKEHTDPEIVLNINFPPVAPDDVAGVAVTRQGRGSIPRMDVEKRTDRRGLDYYWIGFVRHDKEHPEDADITATRNATISVTPLRFDRTCEITQASLSNRLVAAYKLAHG